jgi:hypothetical protein
VTRRGFFGGLVAGVAAVVLPWRAKSEPTLIGITNGSCGSDLRPATGYSSVVVWFHGNGNTHAAEASERVWIGDYIRVRHDGRIERCRLHESHGMAASNSQRTAILTPR